MILTSCCQGKHNKVVQVVNMHTAARKKPWVWINFLCYIFIFLCMCSSFIARLAIGWAVPWSCAVYLTHMRVHGVLFWNSYTWPEKVEVYNIWARAKQASYLDEGNEVKTGLTSTEQWMVYLSSRWAYYTDDAYYRPTSFHIFTKISQ